jgi:DNA-binding NtrC family response regulator
MKNLAKILVIDDDKVIREIVTAFLSDISDKVYTAVDSCTAEEIIKKGMPDLIISDVRMPGKDGIEILKYSKSINSNVPVILITAYDDVDVTIKAMQLGAYDYIEKPLDKHKFLFVVERALETKRLSERLEAISSEAAGQDNPEEQLIGKSESIRSIIKNVGRVSSNRVTILIEGESGTGKEVIAKFIHFCGVTKNEPFIAVNCTALTSTLLESELFGHEKGSFTGAEREKKGKFELAGKGTIFLDEIADISLNLQAKLLRVIQEREFERVGGEKTIKMEARVIAATNRKLVKLVEEGKFREDLYYRLSVFSIDVPPLRDRKEDIPELAVHFLNKINRQLHKNVRKIPYDVIELLQNHRWVGNVRELENAIIQGVILSKGEVLEKEHIFLNGKENNHDSPLQDLTIAAMEKEHIKLVLDKVNWDKKKAAKILGISRQTLYSKIQHYSISPG